MCLSSAPTELARIAVVLKPVQKWSGRSAAGRVVMGSLYSSIAIAKEGPAAAIGVPSGGRATAPRPSCLDGPDGQQVRAARLTDSKKEGMAPSSMQFPRCPGPSFRIRMTPYRDNAPSTGPSRSLLTKLRINHMFRMRLAKRHKL
jgi:hypothetical protein